MFIRCFHSRLIPQVSAYLRPLIRFLSSVSCSLISRSLSTTYSHSFNPFFPHRPSSLSLVPSPSHSSPMQQLLTLSIVVVRGRMWRLFFFLSREREKLRVTSRGVLHATAISARLYCDHNAASPSSLSKTIRNGVPPSTTFSLSLLPSLHGVLMMSSQMSFSKMHQP